MKRNPLRALRALLPALMMLGLVWTTGAHTTLASSAMGPQLVGPQAMAAAETVRNRPSQAPQDGPAATVAVFLSHLAVDSQLSPAPEEEPPGDPSGWVLTFSDEFTGPSLDRNKWATKMPFSLFWWGNPKSDRTSDSGEDAWYLDDAQTIANGALSLTVRRECIAAGRPEIDPVIYNSANLCNGIYTSACTDNGPYTCSDFPYTSGMIASYPSFSQTYGYFEARMRMPAGAGLWPAFWLMPAPAAQPATTPWPWSAAFWPPEIDIAENLGDPSAVHFASHWSIDYPQPGSVANLWYHAGWASGTYRLDATYTGPDFSAGYHTFGLDWQPDSLTWYVDGVARFSTTQNVPPGAFSGKMYIIASLAVGAPGSYPGAPDENTVFPQTLDIDYIRAYQRVTGGTPLPPTSMPTTMPTAAPTNTPTPIPGGGEVVNPANIATLPPGTDVLLDFNNFTAPVDGQALPANYAGCTWNSLVQGSPWTGLSTWNFYIANGGPQATITFPRPVIVRSLRVSSGSSNTFTLSSTGNPDVSVTTSNGAPQTLVTGWTGAVTSLTVRSSTTDQALDDLRFTIQSTGTPASPTSTSTSTRTSTPLTAPTSTPTYTPTRTPTYTPTSTSTRTPTSASKPKPTRRPH